ncbi:enoyl-CoA hydratase/isomerase family protein [Streptomyces acidiscabies]|uniref:enoyl-CoA hydratase/isomerase family protein n=1 Tax=Streptomyces acidiscabies TaxID=42234 RepID=UPI000952E490
MLLSAVVLASFEYRLNARIAECHVPVVSLIDGLCMGGGLGLSVHVVTERGAGDAWGRDRVLPGRGPGVRRAEPRRDRQTSASRRYALGGSCVDRPGDPQRTE